MNQYPRRTILLAVCLSGLAGYVDAIGFLHLGGFFVSFMSGNSTRLGAAIAALDFQHAAIAGGIILSFVGGVVGGEVASALIGERWRRATALLLQAVLLIVAAALSAAGLAWSGVVAMAAGMGIENTIFRRNGEVSIGLTYMTGTLVKMGQHLSAALTGGSRTGWLPYFFLWVGLLSGSVLGAAVFMRIGLDGLWFAGAAAAAFGLFSLGQAMRYRPVL
jgi:uncharacterized membrane protein YoaK (UPF0700 family)